MLPNTSSNTPNTPSAGPRRLVHRFAHLKRALRLVWQSSPRWLVINSVMIAIQSALPLLALYLMKLMLDSVAVALDATDKDAAFHDVSLWIGLSMGLVILGVIIRSLAELASEVQVQFVTNHMYDIIHAKSLEVDLEYYENSDYYNTLHRAQEEAPYRPAHIVNNLLQIGQNGLSLIAIAGLLMSVHWGIAIVLLLATIPGVIVRMKYAGKMYHWQRLRTLLERKTSYFDWLLTGGEYAKEIRLFDLGSFFTGRLQASRQQLQTERLRIITQRSLLGLVIEAGAALAIYGTFAFIAYRTVYGDFTLGALVMYYQAFQRGQSLLQGFLSSLARLYEDNLFLSNLYEFLDLKKKIEEPATPAPIPRPIRSEIVFDRVSFRYAGSEVDALSDVTLRIRPGEVVAVVGENGSGKTTLVKLLCRLYDTGSGCITIDGTDIRQFETRALRREISVIFQDYIQYQMTARENIWVGNTALPQDDEAIIAAARQSGADEVLTRLKHGYDTFLGRWFDEDSTELSIGQWQKVALARAFLRDAQLVILDEPTSALDAKAEYEVFRQFRQLLNGRAAVLISHRMSTVKLADHIYVLHQGKLIESGTHDELMHLNGSYARLFELQAQYYR
ncbi:MAG: ABC transporter ATP-binding protein [Anaerolineae bacterium]|nr:ABC transporter ATP-binding protein [Anaerolineae bacterium]